MDRATCEPLLIDGEEVTAERSFRALAESSAVTMEFTFNSMSLADKQVVVFQYLYHGETQIAKHDDISDQAQTITFTSPKIGTLATGLNGEKELDIHSEVTIIDTVSYENLIPGKTYRLKGVLMDKATEKPLLIDGSEVTAEAIFTPTESSGTVDVVFTFSSVNLVGKTVVVFEYLYFGDNEIAVHIDIEDEGQTVTFKVPNIGTLAHGKDGNKIIPLEENAVVIDVVSFENLVAGAKYRLHGVLMDKETGNPVLVDGNEVTAEAIFVAEDSSGSVEVEFTFDSSGLENKSLVVFEYLYYEDTLIAEHTDIDDEAQTVTVDTNERDSVPTPTPTPSSTPAPKPISPQTGYAGLSIWLLVSCVALAIVAFILTKYTLKCKKLDKK